MYQKKGAPQEALFIPGKLSDFIPEDHILVRVNKVLDLSWLDDVVMECYNQTQGRPCIEPEKALRLMLAGFFHGIVHDRKLMREAQVNIAFRWFCGYELDQNLPDHSSLTRIRKRWGEKRFRTIFKKSVLMCADAGLVGGELVHCDATLVRADVSWESLVATYVEQVEKENPDEDNGGLEEKGGSASKGSSAKPKGKMKKRSKTDPDASMATSNKKVRLEPTYKQHTAVDDLAGVIVDVEVTTGEVNEGVELLNQLGRVEETTGKKPKAVTCDRTYGSGGNYLALERKNIEALIPPQKENRPKTCMPLCRFKYDPKHQIVICPAGRKLHRANKTDNGYFYRARRCDCRSCPLRGECVPKTAKVRSVLIVDGYCALLRARRRKRQGWEEEWAMAYGRHRYQVEGVHGEEKSEHGMRRAARRGLENMKIQSYLTNTAINLKRLALHIYRGSEDVFGSIKRVFTLLFERLKGQVSFSEGIC
jgi:transposase